MKFPEDFLWGVASSSYQIEGGWNQDGKGPSIWDTYTHTAGNIKDGSTGDVACDHVNRYTEDVALIRELGARAYRFSISWPRVMPEGKGRVNAAGVDFYDNLVDALLEVGVMPWPTLFHWDYPQALQDQTGWLLPDAPHWFAEYAQAVVDRLGDRVKHWFTLNEPQVFYWSGHAQAGQAPGLKLPMDEWMIGLKHVLRAHGLAARVLKASGNHHVSYAPVGICGYPASSSAADIQAARDYTFGKETKERGGWIQRPYLDPVLGNGWPVDWEEMMTGHAVGVSDTELEEMHGPLDSLGLNFYSAPAIRAGEAGEPVEVPVPPGFPRTAFSWPVTPEGLEWLVRFHHERYGVPVYITENGLASMDWVSEDGAVHDPNRIDFTRRYLRALHAGIEAGADVRGYFHWSVMDNFEWCEGYLQRFGLIHVDYQTQVRTVKDSGKWYRTVCDANGW